MPCSCSDQTCHPQVQWDIPHPHHRKLLVACMNPERPIDCSTVWDFNCSSCVRHAEVTVTAGYNPLVSVWILGWPRRLPLAGALGLLRQAAR